MKNPGVLLCIFMAQGLIAQEPMVIEVSSNITGKFLEVELTFQPEPKTKADAQLACKTIVALLCDVTGVTDNKINAMKVESFSLNDSKATLKLSRVPVQALLVTGFTIKNLPGGEKEYVLTFSARPKDDDAAGGEKILNVGKKLITNWEGGGVGNPRIAPIPGAGTAKKLKINNLTISKEDPMKFIYKVKWWQ